MNSGRDELAGGIDLGVEGAVVTAADMDNAVALIDQRAVPDQGVRAAVEPDDPAAANDSAHGLLQWLGRSKWVRVERFGP